MHLLDDDVEGFGLPNQSVVPLANQEDLHEVHTTVFKPLRAAADTVVRDIVCAGLNRTETKKHFDKLLSYGICDIYFHVTYSYAPELKPLDDYIRHMLEQEVPPGLSYRECERIAPPDYGTSGYVATYRADHRGGCDSVLDCRPSGRWLCVDCGVWPNAAASDIGRLPFVG